ncbi:MAG: SpoIIIAH-like family protein [Clostridiales bacterium]|jgi:hypothetical protein|nr:SpoIIIAH-like family protein [Clostridiales bacterium]
MLTKKKKIFILAGMVGLLVLTGVLNIVLNSAALKKVGGTGQEVEYQNLFANYRKNRVETREKTVLYLDAIIANEASSPEAKASAEASKLEITKNMELELVLESLIVALGFEDAFVASSAENINVIIKQEELTYDEANAVLDVVLRETSKDASNVVIIPIK